VPLVVLVVLAVGCAPTIAPAVERTVPDPLVAAELPAELEDVPPEDRWTVPAEGVEVAPGDVRDGVLFSDAIAMRAAQLRVEYDRIRGLYQIDLRTWAREREIYERMLSTADEEIASWRQRAERSWWELNGPEVALVLGAVLGIGMTIGIGAVLVELAE